MKYVKTSRQLQKVCSNRFWELKIHHDFGIPIEHQEGYSGYSGYYRIKPKKLTLDQINYILNIGKEIYKGTPMSNFEDVQKELREWLEGFLVSPIYLQNLIDQFKIYVNSLKNEKIA